MIKAIFMGFVFFIVTASIEKLFTNKKVNYLQWFIASVVYSIIFWLISIIW